MDLDQLNNILQEVLNCACSALESGICEPPGATCGCPCRHYLSTGPVAWDNCCDDGQLTIHIERIFQYENFPQQTARPSACGSELAIEVVVTLLRCWPANVKDDGSFPSPQEIQKATESLNRDLLLLSKAVICCLGQKGKNRPFVFSGGRPVGPQGGCAGVEIRFIIPAYL